MHLRCLVQALALLAAMGFQASLAQDVGTDLTAAESLYRSEGAAAALAEFQRLHGEFEARGDSLQAAVAQRFLGECHWQLGEFDAARNHLDAALLAARELNAPVLEAKTLNVLGLVAWDLGEFDTAIQHFERAGLIAQSLGDPRLQGAVLNNASLVRDELGDYETSLAQYQQVLDLYSTVEFPRGVGDTLGNIGGVHLLLGHYSEAIEHYQRALAISEELGSKAAISQDSGNLGLAHLGQGDTEQGRARLERALALAREAGLRQEEGLWLRGLGQADIQAGRYDQGLGRHRAALAVYADAGAEPLLVEALHDMGQLLLALGDPHGAQDHFERAIEVARRVGMERGVTLNQLALGDLQHRHRNLETAAALYLQAHQRAQQAGEQHLEARALLRSSLVHADQQRFGEARREAEEAADLAVQIEARAVEAAARLQVADLDRAAGRTQAALQGYDAVSRQLETLADPDLAWRLEHGRGMVLAETGDTTGAIAALQRAVQAIEGVRSRLREQRFRSGYLQDKHQVYIDLVRLQLETGATRDAFSTAERLRAWSFEDLDSPIAPDEWTAAQRDEAIALRERIRQLQRQLDEEEDRPPPERRQMAVVNFSRELLIAETRYQAFLDDLGRRSGETTTWTGDATPDQIGAGLRDDEALLEYVVGPDHVMMFLLRTDGLHAEAVPISRVDLHARLELLRDLLQQRENERWARPAGRLAEALIEPVIRQGWLNGVKHLYLVPHGILNYLPFALLPTRVATGSPLLVERYSVSYLPSARALGARHATTASSRSVLAVAPERSRLRFARTEVASIARLFEPDASALTGSQATESAFRDQAGAFRTLHLATHGYFNKFNPLLSGLELEADAHNDGLLEVHEILGMDLQSDLVTLSACETGMGSGFFNEIPAGDDFVSLTRAFLKAGSHAVLATLWEVDDRSTVDFMQRFYGRLEDPGATHDKAVALAVAQRSLRASEEFRHPYFWAPFVLVGSLSEPAAARE